MNPKSKLSELEHELKLTVEESAVPSLAAFLDGACRPEHPHHENWVDSLYFDTPGLDLYGEKASSQLIKTKVRLRWYDGRGLAYVEVKRRYGTRRAKHRQASEVAVEELERRGFEAAALRLIPQTLAWAGQDLPRGLEPVLRVRYRRRRWICPGGERLSLDSKISAPAWGARLGAARPGVSVAGAVLEIKGPRSVLPTVLAPLDAWGCRRRSLSKYGMLMDRVLGVERNDA